MGVAILLNNLYRKVVTSRKYLFGHKMKFNRDKAIITVRQRGIQKPEDQNGQYKITRQEEGEREHGKQGRYQEVR